MNRIELSSFIRIPLNEQESVIRWEAGEKEFCFYTSDKNEIKKILRLMDEHPDDIRVKHADKYGIEVIIPRRWLHVRPPRKVTVSNLSEAQRQNLFKPRGNTENCRTSESSTITDDQTLNRTSEHDGNTVNCYAK